MIVSYGSLSEQLRAALPLQYCDTKKDAPMRTDFTTLKLFLTVVEERSIGKAAEREHISAPAISKRIMELEQSLGVKLLNRQSTGVNLTEAGAALAVEVREILSSLDRMKSKLSEYASGQLGRVKLFCSPSGHISPLPDALRTFMQAHPLIDVHVDERHSLGVIHGIAQGEADIGVFAPQLVAGELTSLNGLNVYPYQTLRLVALVHSRHALAKRNKASLAEVAEHDIIGFSDASSIGALIRRMSVEKGLKLKCRLQVTNFDTARRMAQAELGVAILPELYASPHSKTMNLKCISLAEPWAEYRLDICTRASDVLSMPARLMLAHLTKAVAAANEPRTNSSGERKTPVPRNGQSPKSRR